MLKIPREAVPLQENDKLNIYTVLQKLSENFSRSLIFDTLALMYIHHDLRIPNLI